MGICSGIQPQKQRKVENLLGSKGPQQGHPENIPQNPYCRRSTVFSKLDAKHGYWSIVLDDSSSYLTTFNTPFGRYRFIRLPFGLKVSQDIFQEKMDMILEQCPGTTGITDDITVFGKDEKNMTTISTT